MDYEQEFAALWKAVDDEKEAMYVETTDEMMEYILRFSDMERFLKEAYEEGQRRSFWKFHIREPEKDFRNVNIYVTHHFRYDQHETHCHDYFQMCYCVRGGCSIRLSDGVLPLVSGDLLLLAPGTLHSLMVFSDDCSVIKIYVRKSTFDKTFFAILTENNILGDFLRCSLYGACPGRTILFPTGDDPELNYVQIPMTSTQWADGKFTQADYKTLVKAMFDGTIKVSNDITAMPKTTTIKVEDLGNLK